MADKGPALFNVEEDFEDEAFLSAVVEVESEREPSVREPPMPAMQLLRQTTRCTPRHTREVQGMMLPADCQRSDRAKENEVPTALAFKSIRPRADSVTCQAAAKRPRVTNLNSEATPLPSLHTLAVPHYSPLLSQHISDKTATSAFQDRQGRHSSQLLEHCPPPPTRDSGMMAPCTPTASPVVTNHLVQLVTATSRTPPPSVWNATRARTRHFPGPAGMLPRQIPGRNLDEVLVCTPHTPVHGARAKLPPQETTHLHPVDGGPLHTAAWTAMEEDLGAEEGSPPCFLHTYSVAMVLRKAALKQLPKNKVPCMAVAVKSLSHTSGDAKAVFSDPTGEMLGTIHRRLLEDRQAELKVGTVLLLKQVGVFSPSHRSHYLNITANNLLKVYSADGTCWVSSQQSQNPLNDCELEPCSSANVRCPSFTPLQTPTEGSSTRWSDWESDDLDSLLGQLPEESMTFQC
ncbi:homologous recombination OB-fold protein [Polypterus senegalus]|uniref:homologous recombination OB-fold protein n=1 Tax=Polypterus senegalus TaxID=55291 RepID=UPI001966435D|nr:homologous recombination OB-fold protein [Polypterus senegalus]